MTVRAMDFIDDILASLKEKGTYREFRILEGEQGPVAKFDGREVVNLSSNNYLGLNTHPRLKEAAIKSNRRVGRWFWCGTDYSRYNDYTRRTRTPTG